MAYEGSQRLGDLFKSRREKGKPGLPTLSVTLNNGLVDRDSLDRKTDTNLAEDEHLLVRKGDIVYNMMRMWQGASGLAEKDGLVSPAYVVLAPKAKIDSRYASYLFKSQRMIYLFWAYSYGLTEDRLRLYYGDFAQIPVTVAPIEEQATIVEILSIWDKAAELTERLIDNIKRQRSALAQELLTGAKRLPGFKAEWRFLSFDKLFRVANDKSKQILEGDYSSAGSIPIVDQGKNLIAGYCETKNPYTDLPAIVFGDHTREVKWIDFPFAPGADGAQILKARERVESEFAFHLLAAVRLPNLGYSRHMRELKRTEFRVPDDTDEQAAIAGVLTNTMKAQQTLEAFLARLKEERHSLAQQLLHRKPRIKLMSMAGEAA